MTQATPPLPNKKDTCGVLIHASEGIYCAEQNPCKWHTPQSEEKWSLKYCDKCIQMTNHREGLCLKCYNLNGKEISVGKPHSSNGTWEVNLAEEGTSMYEFQKDRTEATSQMFNRDNCYTLHTTSGLYSMLDSAARKLLFSERTSMIGEVEKMKKEIPSEFETGSESSTPRIIRGNGFNQALDQVINYLKNK